MNEPVMFKVWIIFKNGKELKLKMTDTDVDTMFDKLWGRDPIKWMNIWEHIVNFEDVHYVNYMELDKENTHESHC